MIERFGDGGTVRVEHKLNGYLGIAFAHKGVLYCWSKSGPSTFADEFRRLLCDALRASGKTEDDLRDALGKSNVSLTFEVLSESDPHIVSDGVGVALLHAVANTTNRLILIDDVADRFGVEFGFTRPTAATGSGVAFVQAFLEDAAKSSVEGAVLRHLPTGAMVKVKSTSYLTWKSLRVSLGRLTGLTAVQYRDAMDRLRSSNSPRDAAVVDVVRKLTEVAGVSRPLDGFVVDQIGGNRKVVNLPAVRAVVGEEVLAQYAKSVAEPTQRGGEASQVSQLPS